MQDDGVRDADEEDRRDLDVPRLLFWGKRGVVGVGVSLCFNRSTFVVRRVPTSISHVEEVAQSCSAACDSVDRQKNTTSCPIWIP